MSREHHDGGAAAVFATQPPTSLSGDRTVARPAPAAVMIAIWFEMTLSPGNRTGQRTSRQPCRFQRKARQEGSITIPPRHVIHCAFAGNT
jgi:hypothetical protein